MFYFNVKPSQIYLLVIIVIINSFNFFFQDLVKNYGGNVSKSLNKDCTVMIYLNGDSSKHKKAKSMNIPVISPNYITE